MRRVGCAAVLGSAVQCSAVQCCNVVWLCSGGGGGHLMHGCCAGVSQIDRVVEVVEETLRGNTVQLLQKKALPQLDLPKVRAPPQHARAGHLLPLCQGGLPLAARCVADGACAKRPSVQDRSERHKNVLQEATAAAALSILHSSVAQSLQCRRLHQMQQGGSSGSSSSSSSSRSLPTRQQWQRQRQHNDHSASASG
jgi:hypothetical protein